MKKILKVLVVDDNKEGRLLLLKLLTSNNYEVKQACNGIEALESLKASKPDLIISDILMPEMDGFSLIRELNKDISGRKIPVVFYSAQNFNEKDKEIAEKLGASRFIVKPAEPKDILGEIKTVLAEFESTEQKHVKPAPSKNEAFLGESAESVIMKLEGKVRELQQEITKRKIAEELLKSSEKKYRDLFDNANDAICIVDVDLGFKEINTKAVELTGYSKEEILKMGIFELIPPEQASRSKEEFKKLREKGHYEKFIGKMLTKSGNLIDVEVNSSAIIEDGRIMGSMDIIRDITDRKRVEEALLDSEKSLREAQLIAGLGNYVLDIPTGVWKSSDMLDKLFGIDEIYERSMEGLVALFHPDDRTMITDYFKNEVLGHYQAFNKEYRIIRHDDHDERWLHGLGKLEFDAQRRPLKMHGTIQDITESKRAEEKIEASLKEKEILLREIHHRVKNNMQIISSLIGLASENIKDKKYVDLFRESQNRINSMSLIHEKLYRSRDLAKIELNEYIRDLANAIFQSRGVKTGTIVLNINIENVQLGIDQSIPLGLIINELITNSLKYAFPGDRKGEIKVSLHLINENTFELIVGDNGVGIPYDVDFRKTGSLGLRLVTMLVENQLKGKIDLDISKGTEFNIKFLGR
jgi:PAS domain S-box-containing protein